MNTDLTVLSLAELLCARLCHDLSGPVGAAAAGAELFEDGATNVDAETLGLVAASANGAALRLKFFRTAFGPSTSNGLPSIAVRDLIAGYLKTQVSGAGPGIVLDWQIPSMAMSGLCVRLILNMALVGKDSLPRGGRMQMVMEKDWPQMVLKGETASLPDELKAVLDGRMPCTTAKGAQAGLLASLAQSQGLRVRSTIGPHGLAIALVAEKI